MLDNILDDKPVVPAAEVNARQASMQKKQVAAQVKETRTMNQKAFDAVAIHFHDDTEEIDSESWE